MTLHVGTACNNVGQANAMTGSLVASACQVSQGGDNQGCGVKDASASSFGAGMNRAGGGVVVLEWNDTAINGWWFVRGQLPMDIVSGEPNPAGWGSPVASFVPSCNVATAFKNHNIIFDTTLCKCAPLPRTIRAELTLHPRWRLSRQIVGRFFVRLQGRDVRGVCAEQPRRLCQRLLDRQQPQGLQRLGRRDRAVVFATSAVNVGDRAAPAGEQLEPGRPPATPRPRARRTRPRAPRWRRARWRLQPLLSSGGASSTGGSTDPGNAASGNVAPQPTSTTLVPRPTTTVRVTVTGTTTVVASVTSAPARRHLRPWRRHGHVRDFSWSA